MGSHEQTTEMLKKTINHLKRENERLTLALQDSKIGLWDWDVKSTQVKFNTSWMEMLGFKPGDLDPSYSSWVSRVHPEDLPVIRKQLLNHISNKKPVFENQHRIQTKSGEYIWVLERGKFFFDTNGDLKEAIGFQLDITEDLKKRLRYSKVFNHTQDAILILKQDHISNDYKIIDINPALKKSKYLQDSNWEGKYLKNVFPETQFRQLFDLINELNKKPQPKSLYIPLRQYYWENQTLWLSIVLCQTIEDEIIVIFKDYTQEKSNLAKIKKLQFHKSLILDSVNDMIAFYETPDLKITWTNLASATSVNKQIRELIDQPCYAVWQNRSEPCEDCPVLETFNTKQISERLRSTPNGMYYYIKAYPAFNDAKEFLGVVEIGRDITKEKQLEFKLTQAQKMEAIGRLAGGIAHDFNNLLLIINGYSEMILEGLNESGKYREEIMEIYEAGQKAAKLTNQLLTFSKKNIAQPQFINLNDLIKNIQKLIKRLINENIIVSNQLSSDQLWIRADPSKIEQVIMNLVINARDALPAGGKIEISTKLLQNLDEIKLCWKELQRIKGYDQFVLLQVKDNGMGMDEETKLHLFEPFYTTKKSLGGTGLGLSIVYGIVQQAKGIIRVESQLNQGSIFKIYLPAQQEHQTSIILEDDKPLRRIQNRRILVLEDDDSVLAFIKKGLSSLGYEVYTASNGIEGLNFIKSTPLGFDLILTDVIMPELDGPEFVQELNKYSYKSPVLYMSGYSDKKYLNKQAENEEIHFIQKPFSIEKLNSLILEVLSNNKN